MDRGLYVTASGMLAELARQERIANDLANASTPGYKADRTAQRGFAEMLLVNRQTGAPVGAAGFGVDSVEEGLDLTQGALRNTEEPLDVSLDGDGWFAVQTDAGVRYTRNGQFRADAEGRLVTASGQPVLGTDGKPIVLGGTGQVEITASGTIRVAGKEAGTLAVVTLTNVTRAGDGLYGGTAGQAPEGSSVRQGYLESSAVNAAGTMVEMIVSLRAFEAGQRVLHAIDESLTRGISAAGGQS